MTGDDSARAPLGSDRPVPTGPVPQASGSRGDERMAPSDRAIARSWSTGAGWTGAIVVQDVSSHVNPLQNVTFASNGSTAHGYLSLPESNGDSSTETGRGPGVIVIQEWWGLTDHIAGIADRLAREGFVALAPDLFGGRVAHDADEAGQLMSELPEDRAARDLAGAVDFLLAHDAVTSATVGAVGFCMGGGFVLLLAAQQGGRVSAAVPFYGVGAAVPDSFTGVRAAVQGHYGEQDKFYPASAARAQERQLHDESSGPVEYFFYPAGHAFHNDENLLGTYDPESAKLAWSRAVEFLHTNVS